MQIAESPLRQFNGYRIPQGSFTQEPWLTKSPPHWQKNDTLNTNYQYNLSCGSCRSFGIHHEVSVYLWGNELDCLISVATSLDVQYHTSPPIAAVEAVNSTRLCAVFRCGSLRRHRGWERHVHNGPCFPTFPSHPGMFYQLCSAGGWSSCFLELYVARAQNADGQRLIESISSLCPHQSHPIPAPHLSFYSIRDWRIYLFLSHRCRSQ